MELSDPRNEYDKPGEHNRDRAVKRQRMGGGSGGKIATRDGQAHIAPTAPAFDPLALLNPRAKQTQLYSKDDSAQESSSGNMLMNLHGVTDRNGPLKRPREPAASTVQANDPLENKNGTWTGSSRSGGSMLSIPKAGGDNVQEWQGHQNRINANANGHILQNDARQMPGYGHTKGHVYSNGNHDREDHSTGNGASVVDLTIEDDEDEIVILGEKTRPMDPIICFGMLTRISASLYSIPEPPSMKSLSTHNMSMWPRITLKLERGDRKTLIIHLVTLAGKRVGTLSQTAARTITILMDNRLAHTQAVLLPRTRGSEVAGQPTSRIADMNIILYGAESRAKMVGTLLAQHNMFLSDPINPQPGVPYKNPHYPDPKDVNAMRTQAIQLHRTQYSVRTTEEVKNDITAVLDSLEKEQVLEEKEAPACVITPLLPHQKQGLCFMLKKEEDRTFGATADQNSSLWRLKLSPNGSRRYENVITGESSRGKPVEARGGILADEMGLGKTLTVLSLIVSTLPEAQTYSQTTRTSPKHEDDPSEIFAKTTLLICPLSVLMNWEDQMKTHIEENALTSYVYHGNSRINDIEQLAQYDIVITTYALVASDFNREMKNGQDSVLRKINYFRIVLDEAHTIREAATIQSKAVCTLEASRRWAVTGTPIQNRLDDLATLIKFLSISPFDSRTAFNQYIAGPLKSGDPTSMDKLRALVDSVALRRKKDKINLPKKHDNTLLLKFSQSEQELYDATLRQSNYKMDMVVKSGHISGRAYVHILQTILRLRMICASRDLLGEEDTAGLLPSEAIDLDSIDDNEKSHAMGIGQAFGIFNLMKESDEDICYMCEKKVTAFATKEGTPPSEIEKNNVVFGHLTSCPHLFCADCGPKFINRYMQNGYARGSWVNCHLCNQSIQVGTRELKPSEDPTLKKDERIRKRVTYKNPSTKIMALVQDLLENREKGDEKGRIKSVIFSGWTMHLDLIEAAFATVGIVACRIDGKMTRTQRTEALTSFRENDDVEAIVISISAGGVGLNLTTASKVYVMEPQFNPAAEAQAIDRVHRLGQEREVYCIRYIMQDSFEEKIVQLQKKKQKIAELSMTQGKSRKQQAQDKIDDLKDLFR